MIKKFDLEVVLFHLLNTIIYFFGIWVQILTTYNFTADGIVVSFTAVIRVVTQRSSLLTVAHSNSAFLS